MKNLAISSVVEDPPSAAYARNKRSIRNRRRSDADYTGLTIEHGVRNVSLVDIEKVAKGLKKSLPDLFGRI